MERMKASKIQSAVEAILFAAGEPVELQKIAAVFDIEPELADRILYNLSAELDERKSGICLLRLGDKYQLSSRTEYAEIIRDFLELRKNTPLSQAAFEVLAVIAYNQPVTKSFVEQVRGVDCSGVITTLCQKKLIEEKGRLDLPGRPLVYGTTPEFLRVFGISSLEELPTLPSNSAKETDVADETENGQNTAE